jgi:hypothetical protein
MPVEDTQRFNTSKEGIVRSRLSSSKGIFLGLAVLAVVFLTGGASYGKPINGTYCIQVHKTADENGLTDQYFNATFQISPAGGAASKNAVNAFGRVAPPDDDPFILTGSGIILGTRLYMNLISTQHHTSESWLDSGVMQVRIDLDKDDWSGDFYEIRNDLNTETPQVAHGFSLGTLSKVSCK